MKYHGTTNYLENKSNIQTKKLNIECFKYNIFSKEALNIIKKWHILTIFGIGLSPPRTRQKITVTLSP